MKKFRYPSGNLATASHKSNICLCDHATLSLLILQSGTYCHWSISDSVTSFSWSSDISWTTWTCSKWTVLWRCWLGGRKNILPMKTWVMRCWHGYLSGARCKWLTYGPADATDTPSPLLQKNPKQFTGIPVSWNSWYSWNFKTVLKSEIVLKF